MSATIYWRYLPQKTLDSLNVSTPSSFVEAMTRSFGKPPWTLKATDASRLGGMADVFGGLDRHNPYLQILDHLIDSDGQAHSLEVWPEY